MIITVSEVWSIPLVVVDRYAEKDRAFNITLEMYWRARWEEKAAKSPKSRSVSG